MEIDNQIQQLLKNDLIEPSYSPYAAPVTLAFKKDEGRRSRLCVDYRLLNKLVIPECYPFPRVVDVIEKTIDCEYFSTVDINSAFWAIEVSPNDRDKLSFVTEEGHYKWKVLPFGFKNSPIIFQRILSNFIRKHNLLTFCTNYMDDIIIYSKSYREHLNHLNQVLKMAESEGFKFKMKKCQWLKKNIVFLGHNISKNKITPVMDGIRAIKEFPIPKDRKNVRQFLGKINYYHRFIENCANRLDPLHNLLRKNVPFEWTEACNEAFEDMKACLCKTPILQIFNGEKPIVICTDASRIGLAAILKQPDETGFLHPVAYFSKKLSQTQLRKDAIYIECLAIKEAIVYWQHLLIGKEFTVLSDHKPLENLNIKARPDTALGELVIFLSQFNFTIRYQKGMENIEADTLSRNPILFQADQEEKIKTCNLIIQDELMEDQRENTRIDKIKTDNKNGIYYRCRNNKKKLFYRKPWERNLSIVSIWNSATLGSRR